ncbi:hypothetical protein IFM89_012768 [Coptis chinensis]|uniref:Uncharacterized protein n=1 Tax=Coptis chinensis TaxID=261450 RepID=A0A835HAB6_9MAGN|nr:hypothetical protein IFM89_012768 [Coptis chinensis]
MVGMELIYSLLQVLVMVGVCVCGRVVQLRGFAVSARGKVSHFTYTKKTKNYNVGVPDMEIVGCHCAHVSISRTTAMAGKAAKSVVKAVGEFQYPWKEKLVKYKDELSKGVWGYWELGAWKPLGISGRRRARLRKEVLLAGQDWPYDPARKEMRTKRKGHKVDRVAAEKRANTAELMKKMPDMLLDYKKRRWAKKMKEEDAKD